MEVRNRSGLTNGKGKSIVIHERDDKIFAFGGMELNTFGVVFEHFGRRSPRNSFLYKVF
ncbi:hypothetical protein SAMN04487934_11117 [Eubacterium ruminantium]|nr:hypothetical protein SAMN04487934_11117 [Eubacterium ruminantium]